jgi:chorismate mutase-like protein
MDIDGWRERIDGINHRLADLLNERAQCAIEIGKIKKQKNLPVADPARENHIIDKMKSINYGPLDDEALHHIFHTIIEQTKRIEAQKSE